MWPWSSAVFGYLCYTLYTHLRYREAPDGWMVLLVAIASPIPDLIDKPLNWQFHVFQNGYALGHSIFFAALVTAVVYGIGGRWDRSRLGIAVGIGFVSHDLGDTLEHIVEDGNVWFGLKHMLWPVYKLPPSSHPNGVSGTTFHYLIAYLHDILTLHPTPYLILVTTLAAIVLPLWIYDGCPGLREVWIVLTYPISATR